jgi:hypothetical protein
MKKTTQEVGVDVTDKKKYVKPEIEAIPIDVEAPLLTGSTPVSKSFGADFGEDSSEDW